VLGLRRHLAAVGADALCATPAALSPLALAMSA
jgi:hypothetical protein